jgi:SEC-C motif-containing protein
MLPYAECCEPLHRGRALAPTAARLMRSRYSAFALGEVDYLLSTWWPKTRPAELELYPDQRWLGLDIVHTTGGLLDDRATVEFIARYSNEGVRGEQHEVSSFVRDRGRWFYVGEA